MITSDSLREWAESGIGRRGIFVEFRCSDADAAGLLSVSVNVAHLAALIADALDKRDAEDTAQ